MIALGCDHGGFALKEEIINYLKEKNIEYKDFGCYDKKSCDYPEFGRAAAEAVASGECDRGIVICTTGIGISIVANKVKGIRCALCADTVSARLTREHNNANIIAFGQDYMSLEDVKRRTDIFLESAFLEGYHCTRIEQLKRLEEGKKIYQTPRMNG